MFGIFTGAIGLYQFLSDRTEDKIQDIDRKLTIALEDREMLIALIQKTVDAAQNTVNQQKDGKYGTNFAEMQGKYLALLQRKGEIDLIIQFVSQQRMSISQVINNIITANQDYVNDTKIKNKIENLKSFDMDLVNETHRLEKVHDDVEKEIAELRPKVFRPPL